MARILVVEDEPRLRHHLVRALSLEGHEVIAAADGRAASAKTRRFHPDLLVVDWMLGAGEDGAELAVRLQSRFPRLGTILITGHPTDELAHTLERGTIHVLLRKPFEPKRLFDAVSRLERERCPAGGPRT
jgi:DNA-binding response OmpR family regulator